MIHCDIDYKLYHIAEGSADHVPKVLVWFVVAEFYRGGEAFVRVWGGVVDDVIYSADAGLAHALQLLDFSYERCYCQGSCFCLCFVLFVVSMAIVVVLLLVCKW